ncbi:MULTISPECIES: ABC-F family ATP-binding cassette domain-containing protein [unclassified Mycolicibacterium]|uniref:ABC-F family ATP-binding cassette domain-containing protein n=1 Tax=unclassified Mycolicibacterium TaxID=2636767 RepID=UPI0012DEE092|nr:MULTISPECIES: ATP-binding cassette domain-containing protein [unclassified Mycolicibacterium]MUL85896.1 ABC-F family ATP-binding cassette domain-containing protein [Mycolicibacterium sp. CBMA 329]MUL91664.1 ABC-F family ATP-binding cassette domain-containing protein [Mycolicibacterium sp. CBMA 331]MUM03116.1 ABC-F family ATP-binding cassette domain-containing protein [Mycolicibacterium sp. CBMA 334]MUM27733.1 ABC-F family ATP-binding cassette domain-containing protein [Mycolicibacterium sp. 
MGHVEVAHISHTLPDGRQLLNDVSFRIADGATAALVGPNGAGKTTLLRLISGDLVPQEGTVAHSGGLGVMRQFIGGIRDSTSVYELLLSVAPSRLRAAGTDVEAAEVALMERDDEPSQIRYANALAGWGDAGGYDAEILWDACCIAALGMPYESCRWRLVNTLSGGEQKRLVLEALLRGPDDVLLLDEPDNYLDVPGKQWLEERLGETAKTILMVSHDRELLNRAAERIVTVESRHVWIHGGRFDGYAQARRDRNERLEELRRRWDEEHAKLKTLVVELRQKAAYNDGMSSRYQAALTRLRKFEEAGPPEVAPRDQDIKMRLQGGRTGRRAVICEDLELTGLMRPFDLEISYGERVAVLGSNGSGKSHFLRLLTAVADELPRGALAAEPVAHSGVARLGARVSPGLFAQTHARPDLVGRTPCEIVMVEHARLRTDAMSALARYELQTCAEQPFETLSGGQQARLQILLLELGGATLLLLDEPTDNLDLASAEALQHGLAAYQGTVVAVTHDRWFARSFDRFLVFGADGLVYESPEPVWDESRVMRTRR